MSTKTVDSPIRTRAKRSAPTQLWAKQMTITLIGASRDEIREVAHAIHSLNHKYLVGGMRKRVVHMFASSSEPVKIFAGRA